MSFGVSASCFAACSAEVRYSPTAASGSRFSSRKALTIPCSADTSAPTVALTGRNCGFLSETVAYWAQPAKTRAMKMHDGFMVIRGGLTNGIGVARHAAGGERALMKWNCRCSRPNIAHRTSNIEHRMGALHATFRSMLDVQCSMFDVRPAAGGRAMMLQDSAIFFNGAAIVRSRRDTRKRGLPRRNGCFNGAAIVMIIAGGKGEEQKQSAEKTVPVVSAPKEVSSDAP